ncbi:MAG: hypothetical protein COA79_05305 [Planctomycetota bacterium]|nr:MAG: hypothetical protein COA79_05305 [Planctomycetota bacterium]
MAKKPIVSLKNYGIYSKWNSQSKEIPELIKYTDIIPAELEIEFGYILHIQKAKGSLIKFIIDHPPFTNDSDEIAPPFEGQQYIQSNDYYFFLGDTLWAPLEDKIGKWRLRSYIDKEIIADKTLIIESKSDE